MKKLIAIAFTSVFAYTANAQLSATANQSVNLELSNIIEMKFTSTGTSTGPNLNFQFTTINDFVNGVESAPQELSVSSNKPFTVKVKADAATFTGPGLDPMHVQNTLYLRVPSHATGGTLDGDFAGNAYASLRDFDQFMLINCNAGMNKTFNVQYKATPGFTFTAGNYSIGVVYTATQL